MIRSKPLTALLLTAAAMLALSGCRTTVVEPAPQPASQPVVVQPVPEHHDDHRDDRHPPPPPPDHRNDRPQDHH